MVAPPTTEVRVVHGVCTVYGARNSVWYRGQLESVGYFWGEWDVGYGMTRIEAEIVSSLAFFFWVLKLDVRETEYDILHFEPNSPSNTCPSM